MKKVNVLLVVLLTFIIGSIIYFTIDNENTKKQMKDTKKIEESIQNTNEKIEEVSTQIQAEKEKNKEEMKVLEVWEKAKEKLKEALS